MVYHFTGLQEEISSIPYKYPHRSERTISMMQLPQSLLNDSFLTDGLELLRNYFFLLSLYQY